MTDWRRRWEGLFDEMGNLRAVALARLLFGPIVVFHLWGFWTQAIDGRTYQDRFHEPFWNWLPNPPESLYSIGLTVGVLAGVMMTVGLASRVANATAFVIVGYNLLLDQTAFQHNRAFLLLNLGLLALQPTGRALSLDARRYRRRLGRSPSDEGLLWPMYLQRVLLASVYLSSGISKLLDPEWVGGLVLWDRVVRFQQEIVDLPFGDQIVDVLTERTLYRAFAPIVLATELFIGLGLWHRRTRLAAVWVAIVFHVSIELTADVHTFSYSAIAALTVWAVPSTRDRHVLVADPLTARRVRRLDWLARFHIDDIPGISTLTLVDRDRTEYTGRAARQRVLLRLPATFFFIAPSVALDRARARRDHQRNPPSKTREAA